MLPGILGGFQGGLQGHCHVLWLELPFRLLAFLPSLPPIFWGKYLYSTHWFLSVMCWRVPGRWTVARLPWWPPCCWGECCLLHCYLYGTYPPKYWRGVLSAGNEESAKRLIETLNPLSVVDVEKVDFTKLPKDILGTSIISDIDQWWCKWDWTSHCTTSNRKW